MNLATLALFGLPGGSEWIVIGLVALLIFGRRLPDVARSVGKSIVEFKKGLKDVKNEIDVQSSVEPAAPSPPRLEQQRETPAASPASPPKEESQPTGAGDSAKS